LTENETIQQSIGLISSHNSLSGREEEDAHPQYLLKSGGTITGDILVEDGVKIGGIELGKHAHTGEDGSAKISGKSIEFGTLTSEVVDINEDVPKPINVRLTGYSDSGQIGEQSFLAANIFWESLGDGQMYEIQITRRDGATYED
jgi:hypothetical protein